MHLMPFTKPLTSKSRNGNVEATCPDHRNANVEAPCPDHSLSFGESGNLHLCVAHAILHLTKTPLRNSSTLHWTKLCLRLESSSAPYQESLPCQDDS